MNVRRVACLLILTALVTISGFGIGSALASPSATGGSNTLVPPKIPAGIPASKIIKAKLSAVKGATCGVSSSAKGQIQMANQHVSGPHTPFVYVVITLKSALPKATYQVQALFGKTHGGTYERTAGHFKTSATGAAHVGARFTPDLSTGKTKVVVTLNDLACGTSLHHPAAYTTKVVNITLA